MLQGYGRLVGRCGAADDADLVCEEVAKETASRFNPRVKINAIHGNIKEPQFDLAYFRGFANGRPSATLGRNAVPGLKGRLA
jgi:hypothetical protein